MNWKAPVLLLVLCAAPALSNPAIQIQTNSLYKGIEQPITVELMNPDPHPSQGKLHWILPSGWEISPQDAPYQLDSKGMLLCKHRIRPRAVSSQESDQITVKADGLVSSQKTDLLEPFNLGMALGRLRRGEVEGSIDLWLHNRTSETLSGELKINLPGKWVIPGGSICKVTNLKPDELVYFQIRFERKSDPTNGTIKAVFKCQESVTEAEIKEVPFNSLPEAEGTETS